MQLMHRWTRSGDNELPLKELFTLGCYYMHLLMFLLLKIMLFILTSIFFQEVKGGKANPTKDILSHSMWLDGFTVKPLERQRQQLTKLKTYG